MKLHADEGFSIPKDYPQKPRSCDAASTVKDAMKNASFTAVEKTVLRAAINILEKKSCL